MKVYINYEDPRWKKYEIDFNAIANSISENNDENSEVSIILTNDIQIHKLNKQYRNINKPTNVLSFESGDDILLGDIYISFDTVMKESENNKKEFLNHTAHMIIHGILHLIGYDHMNNKDADKMENLEIKYLKKLGIKNPYQESVFDKLKSDKISIIKTGLFFSLGLISSFGFAPFNLWFLTIFGIGIVYYLYFYNNEKQKFWTAFFNILPFGAGYALGMFWWMLNSIYVVPELAAQFAIWTLPALIGIGIFGGIIFSIPFLIIRCIRQKLTYRAILFAVFWVFVLWLREWFLTGFPWNPIANLSLPFPVISNSMSLFGALGLSFIIIGLIASITDLIRYKKTVLMSVFIFSGLLLFGILFGYENVKKSEILNSNRNPIIRIVQPAKSATEKASHSREEAIKNAEENINSLVLLSQLPGKYDLIVFPETTYPYLVYKDNIDFIKKLNKPAIIGTLSYDNKKIYNSLAITNNSGEIQKIYSKSHLVPFGEYRPFGDLIPTPGQLTSGNGSEILSIDINSEYFNFAPAICYEIIFSDSLVPKNSKLQPHAIMNLTNDTWFGNTPGSYQHLDMVRRYAIESGIPIIRANYSGISAFIASDGKVLSMLPIGKSGVLDGQVGGEHMTVYRKLGRDNMMIIILLFALLCLTSISVFQKKD